MVSGVPFQSTVELATKLLPFTVRVNGVEPAATDEGESDEIEGAGLEVVIVNDAPLEVPPPGVGLTTVTVAVPVVVTSDAGTDAVSCDALTYVVVSAAPFQSTVEEATKSLPLTVRVNAAVAPSAMLDGESEEIAGAGFTAVTVKV